MNNHQPSQGHALLVVNTGHQKKKFILQRLKRLGYLIVCLNREKNWAQAYVDQWILADTTDHLEATQAVDKFIKRSSTVKVAGALTFWEDDVLLTSKITDRFNFIGIPFHIAKKARNKYLFRHFCFESHLPVPQFRLVTSGKDLDYVREKFTFPVVAKPAYGSSSAFVMKIDNEKALPGVIEYIKNNISVKTESALSDGLDIFIEEYIDGDEVDIDILLQNGKIKFYSVSDNFNKCKGSFFVDSGQAIPSTLPDHDQDELVGMAEEILEKLGIQNGCIHFEAKYSRKGPVPIEVNLRLGGDYVYSYIKGAWGIDLIDSAAKISLGEYLKIGKPVEPKKYIIGWDLRPDNSGILVELDIDDKIKEKKFLEEIHVYKQIGDPILVPPEGYEYLGWVTASGDNFLDAQDNLSDILNLINFRVVKFDTESSLGKTSRKDRFSAAVLNKDLLIRSARLKIIEQTPKSSQRQLHLGIVCNCSQLGTRPNERFLETICDQVGDALKGLGYRVAIFNFDLIDKAYNQLAASNVDLVFNLAERIHNQSLFKPHAATLIETLQIPYTGSDPYTLTLCADKIRTKKLLTYHNIPTPKWDYVYDLSDEIREDLDYPLIVKPSSTDQAVGITNDSVVTNKKELERELKKIVNQLHRPALIEEYIPGDEYDISILGSDESDFRVLPLSRSIFKKMPPGYRPIYTYEAKWLNDPAYQGLEIQRPPKNIGKKLEALITEIALDTYNILDCRDYGRVEIRVDEDNNPYVLEANPNPALESNSCLPLAAKLAHISYPSLLEEIISSAIRRHRTQPWKYHYQGNQSSQEG